MFRLSAAVLIIALIGSGAIAAGPSLGTGGPYIYEQEIRIAACGDIMMDRGVASTMRKLGESWPFSGLSGLLSGADIAFANLETSVSERGSRIDGKGIWFRSRPEHLQLLSDAGIDIVSAANNHIMDYGLTALTDTLSHLDAAGIRHAGAGRNIEEARQGAILEANGLKVGFLAYSDFHDIFWSFTERFTFAATGSRAGMAPAITSLMVEDVRRMKRAADFVVVSVHWGQEYMRFPDNLQVERAHALADAGADLVLGHHPHVLQPVECYKGSIIFYSLGNFIFDQEGEGQTESMIATVSLRKGQPHEAELVPMRITQSRPAPMEGAEAAGSILAMAEDSLSYGSRIFSRDDRMYLAADGKKPDMMLKRVIEDNPFIFPGGTKGRQ